MFLEASGRNRTPDRLPAAARAPLLEACDQALRRTVEILGPQQVIGIGRFAESRAHSALRGMPVEIGGILHPSPANPAANQNWRARAEEQLTALGVEV
jgi:single-strand selective monofunctional uracil DNA glycosylase